MKLLGYENNFEIYLALATPVRMYLNFLVLISNSGHRRYGFQCLSKDCFYRSYSITLQKFTEVLEYMLLDKITVHIFILLTPSFSLLFLSVFHQITFNCKTYIIYIFNLYKWMNYFKNILEIPLGYQYSLRDFNFLQISKDKFFHVFSPIDSSLMVSYFVVCDNHLKCHKNADNFNSMLFLLF